ncbi:MAG TPA: hypothetical protein EYQ81_07685 [Sneathiellales bacterium]|nr:hypothetical protein [Sneathiellales bacterium]
MPKIKSLPPLNTKDVLGRGIFSGRRAKRAANNNISHDLFLEAEGAFSLSVDRLDHESNETMAEIGDRTASLRNKKFFGWATVTVTQASEGDRSVQETPKLDNIFHADIFLNIPAGSERRDQEKQQANELAAVAKWRQRPTD